MDIYTAMHAAADHIDRNPKSFRFFCITAPSARRPVGCAIGWIGHYLGLRGEMYINETAKNIFYGILGTNGSVCATVFYSRMAEFSTKSSPWTRDPHVCATALRAYAEKYHKPTAPRTELPVEVRAIFEKEFAHV